MITPDYDKAATRAAETLLRFGINSAPINPIPMILGMPDVVTLVTFSDLSDNIGIKRQDLMKKVAAAPDAFSSVSVVDGELKYIIAYNAKLGENNHSLHCALAREFGHVMLQHDGSLPYDVCMEEVRCFHHHLLCPRPLIHLIQSAGIRITSATLNFMTGCNDQCLASMKTLPATHVPAFLNEAIRDFFKEYFINHFECQRVRSLNDGTALADFGTYMDGYEE